MRRTKLTDFIIKHRLPFYEIIIIKRIETAFCSHLSFGELTDYELLNIYFYNGFKRFVISEKTNTNKPIINAINNYYTNLFKLNSDILDFDCFLKTKFKENGFHVLRNFQHYIYQKYQHLIKFVNI